MTICRRCHGDFDKDDDEHSGMHWSCLTYEEKMALEVRRRCGHKKTYTAKICKDCGKKVR